jgi:ribA/ribD-fused uncharacterized protein
MKLDRRYWQGKFINSLAENEIFVFGSNPQARHFAGAAKSALKFGAVPIKRNREGETIKEGVGRGISGKTYALVTKNLDAGYYETVSGITYDKKDWRSVSPEQISANIEDLYTYARLHPEKEFLISYQYEYMYGKPKKSLNGYDSQEMVDMFIDNKDVPDNIVFNESYKEHIEKKFVKKQRMTEIKDAYNEAKENNQVRTITFNPNDPNCAYQVAMNSSKRKFSLFFSQADTFSQWHPSLFKHKEFQFISAEQFMMFSKAKLFNDDVVAAKIMMINQLDIAQDFINGKIERKGLISNNSHAAYERDVKYLVKEGYIKKESDVKNMYGLWSAVQRTIKAMGKESKFVEKTWLERREGIIFSGSKLKYSQNPDMLQELNATKGSVLVEASPYDAIYGVKLGKKDPKIHNPENWKGLNLLGKALTNLRYYFTLELKKKQEEKNEVKDEKKQKRRRPRP